MCEDRLGLVSNCWKVQLDAGESLTELTGQAADLGFRFVELRQGCLGEFEDAATRMPDPDALKLLTRTFPQVTFNLAVELPLLSSSINPASSDVDTLLQAARALAAETGSETSRPAHLRIVDLVSREVPQSRLGNDSADRSFSLEDVITSLHALERRLAPGIVSVEHSLQAWSGIQRLFEIARPGSGQSTSIMESLRLCYDPCNLWLTGDGKSADLITESLPVDWLSMVHLKQLCGGTVSTRFEPGNVDWRKQFVALARSRYAGPFLFETAPTEDVWGCLADSRRYLAELVCEMRN
ncbi:MAG: TIM barrel protein [Planctomycetota bacterium]|nr:TIM barrel protein [Planctomycetota bacterium]